MEFHLKQKDKLLGTLRSYDSNFPWINCKFEPTEAFQAIKPLFDEKIEFLESGDFENLEAADKQLENLAIKLVNLEDGKIVNEFLLHIQGDEAWFRY
ncbi:MAG TPA: hypothetical protein VNB22_01515 [Pyrinomonadaceae bacterium]|jgi:hypothetical protein|nr:hypothetical protein [Pyrinomonadaceae bacterium]